jgi:hypothetical protein
VNKFEWENCSSRILNPAHALKFIWILKNEMKDLIFLPDNFENNVEDGVVERVCGNFSSLQCAN